MMSETDKAVSYRVLRTRLFFAGHTDAPDAPIPAVRQALRSIPNIEDDRVLWGIVGPDGMWAARQVLAGGAVQG